MTNERPSDEHPVQKCSVKMSSLNLSGRGYLLPLASLVFLSVYSVIAVRGFSTVPTTVRGQTKISTIAAVPKHERSTAFGSTRPAKSIRETRSTVMLAGLFGEQTKIKNQNNTYISATSDWQIYVDQSRPSLDRGGDAIFDAFFSLCDTSGENFDNDGNEAVEVQVIPALLPKPASGGKGPWIRCIWNTNNKKNLVRPSPNLDVSNVDSVEKVYRVLSTHLGVKNISIESCECLKWKYKGNNYLESGEIKLAIDSYDQALAICEEFSALPSNSSDSKSYNSIVLKQQEGIILLLRAKAFLKQAQSHKEALQSAILEDGTDRPSSELLLSLLSEALSPSSAPPLPEASSESELVDAVSNDEAADGNDRVEAIVNGNEEKVTTTDASSADEEESTLSQISSPFDSSDRRVQTRDNNPQLAIRLSVLRKLQTNGSLRKAQLRKIQYRHGLYQTSLLQATRDSLRATEVLPSYSTAWLSTGELLSDLWKIKESKQYYEKALSIDDTLQGEVSGVLKELEARQELVDRARDNKEWPEDSLQLALDIAG